MRVDLSPELRAIVDAQLQHGRFATEERVISAAILLLEEAAPADGSAARSGSVHDLAKLKGVYEVLQRAKLERDFVLHLTARQRAIRHPEAILQMTAESLGQRLSAQRVGFFHMAGERTLDFGACWTDGSVRVLHGRMPVERLGKGVAVLLENGDEVVTQNCRTDPAVDGDLFAELSAVGMICVPVLRDRRWEGGLYVHSAEARPWTVAEATVAREVAELTWDAIERARLLERLRGEIGDQRGQLTRAAEDLRAEVVVRQAAEGQVSQLQKLDLVGQLTGGIAHDFNNMLAVIIGGLNLMQRRLARGETDVARYADAAMDGAMRAALTQRLLAFSRSQPLAPEAIDPNKLIAGMDELLTRTLGEAISVETVLGAGVWATKADVSQLENAILNLAVNARDAMPEGGRLTIETGNVSVDDAYAKQNAVAVGQYVLLAVSDTGAGMSPEVLARVFEPFFTTKAVGKGTGLGLSQVFGFVRQSEGTVRVYSEVGHGTTIRIYLPRFYGAAAAVPARRDTELAIAPRGDPREIVLVVEDEDRVRGLAVETLRDLGYTVLHADSGPAALKLLDEGQDVTLLFTDIVMPEMTGRELADQALRRRPQLKVLYTTGYTRNAVVHNGVIDPGTNFIPKPFSIDKLASMVRSVIDS